MHCFSQMGEAIINLGSMDLNELLPESYGRWLGALKLFFTKLYATNSKKMTPT